jgi:hypothetical protein
MKVKNIGGYRSPSCNCRTFICHWKNYKGDPVKCSNVNCNVKTGLVGGHVKKCHGNAYGMWYIIPICNSCNRIATDECYEIESADLLVPVSNRTQCKPC